MADVTAGIDWVVANKATYGIEAINLSLGTAGCSNGSDATSLAVNNAHNQGIVVGVAAGNSGPGTCTIGSPGAAANALTVGAMADMGVNGFKQAYFSSRGKTADGRLKPDVSAPGVSITSAAAGTGNGYTIFSGTSMATPFTVGVALLMRDANPAFTPQQVKSTITGTAVDWARGGDDKTPGTTGQDIDYGWGRLDGYAAIEAAKGVDIGTPPPGPTHLLRGHPLGHGRDGRLPTLSHEHAVPHRGDADHVEPQRRRSRESRLRPLPAQRTGTRSRPRRRTAVRTSSDTNRPSPAHTR